MTVPTARRFRIVGVLAICLVGCTGTTMTPSPSIDAGTPSPAPAANWVEAVEDVVSLRESIHPEPYQGIDETAYRTAADELIASLPGLSEEAAFAGLVRLAAMPSWNGRDGHSGMFPFTPDSGTHAYPVRFWRFSDGLVITAAQAPIEDLVGARVTAIDGVPIDDVLARVEPLTPRDNPSNVLAYSTIYLRSSELLAGVGVIDEVGRADFSVIDRDGVARDVTIEPITATSDAAWNSGMPHRLPPRPGLWLERQSETIWWRYLEDSGTVFIQYNEVRSPGDIPREILDRVASGGVERVVLDLRHNGGGDNTTYAPMLDALRDPSVDRPSHLFVLIGRITFSAAGNLATDLEQTTGATFAGEDMGSSPNMYGDARRSPLPSIGQALFTATRYWQKSTPHDPRITIEPELAVPLSSDDYFADRDPVLEAILEAPLPDD